jgi:hypothetical protein
MHKAAALAETVRRKDGMNGEFATHRRGFLKTSVLGGLCAWGAGRLGGLAALADEPVVTPAAAAVPASRVALTTGEDHADIVFQGLKNFSAEIARAIGSRRVVVKPNNVAVDIPLSATQAECLEGTLEFLKSIG